MLSLLSILVNNIRARRRILITFSLIYIITFTMILPMSLRKIKHSIFYSRDLDTDAIKHDIRTERDLNIDRAQVALDFLEMKRMNSVTNDGGLGSLHVLISVISLRRNLEGDGYDPFYLSQTVTRAYQLIREFEGQSGIKSERRFGLALCNVDASPEEHTELTELSESLNIAVFNRFENRSVSEQERNDVYEKEKGDYAYCLKESLKSKPKYVLLLEDDTVPVDNALWVIDHMITTYLSKDFRNEIAYVKFYHPPRFLPLVVWPEVVGLGLICSTVALFSHYLVSRPRRSELWLRWILWTFYFILIFITIGHVNTSQLRHFSKHFYIIDDALECCTPSVLYPYESASTVANYLDAHLSNSSYAKDLVLLSYLKESGAKALMVTPNVFKHIGMYSVVKAGIKDPYIVD
ncbi:post-GPI attachment to proteins factor 4-like [Lineus longissimus]|uniref:post-GPI attachment to proteins factor 4-like n=1 Tax=Lineus longissimus TaxID=88925 RepID=UPI002B4F5D8F